MSELRKMIAEVANSTKKFDRENVGKMVTSKDKTVRESGVSTLMKLAGDATPAEQVGDVNYRLDKDGNPYGPPMDRLDEGDGIGGGTRVDRPMQPVGTEKGRIRKRNVELVNNPKKALAMAEYLRSTK